MTALESFLIDLARAAAAETLPRFRADCPPEDKGGASGYDPVTEADRQAEGALRRLIAQRHPDHGVIGEEYGEDRPDAEFVWVLDPIDGTRAFVAGLPLWTTLIGLRHQGRPVLGAISQPWIGELFLGGPSGARLMARGTERPLVSRKETPLAGAVIATTDPKIFTDTERAAWDRLRGAARLARLGCDAYAYAMVADGRIDLVAESGLKAWDWTALIPVVEAAGGRVTDWRGGEPGEAGQVLASGDAALAEAVFPLLADAAL